MWIDDDDEFPFKEYDSRLWLAGLAILAFGLAISVILENMK